MKQKKNNKTAVRGNGLRLKSKSGRNDVRRSFSKKPINFSGQKKANLMALPETKPNSSNNKTVSFTGRLLRFVPKKQIALDTGADKDTSTAAEALQNETDNKDNNPSSKTSGKSSGGSGSWWNNPRVSGLVAAVLLLAMLAISAWSSVSSVKAGEEPADPAAQTASLQLAKEYIYAGSRMLAIEDYGLSPTPVPVRANVALASNGGTTFASSELNTGVYSFPASGVNNGDRKGLNWGTTGGWSDATVGVFPDWVQINFNGTKSIDEINVFTIQDNYTSPIEPTESMTFSQFGITAFDVQYWNGSAWATVPNGNVTSNNKVWSKFTFSPITTSGIRVVVSNSALADYCRIIEVEAFGVSASTAVSSPPTPNNIATFLRTDTSTQGNWIGVYGGQGYKLAEDGEYLPSWAQVSLVGQANHTWAASTTDTRALKKVANNGDRLAATWYTSPPTTPYTIPFNFTDGQTHQIAIYALDWDSLSRAGKLELFDGDTNELLDIKPLDTYSGGKYFVWKVKGKVTVKVTATASNAVISGIFIDNPSATTIPTPTPPTPTPVIASCPTGYNSLDGVIIGNPTATVFNNTLYVFVRGTDNAVDYRSTTDGSNFAPYVYLGGYLITDPTTLVTYNALYVQALGSDSNSYYRYTTDGSNFAAWAGGTVSAQATASAYFNGNTYTFVKGGGTQPPLCFNVTAGGNPTPTPPTPTPTPIPDNYSPVGNIDGVDGNNQTINGWSYDPDNPSASNVVHIYIGGPAGSGTFLGSINADISRPDVNSAYGITGNHGFSFPIPPGFIDGYQHSVYIYGLDTGANSPSHLNNSPVTFTLGSHGCNAPQKVKDECTRDGGTWNNQTCNCDYPEEEK